MLTVMRASCIDHFEMEQSLYKAVWRPMSLIVLSILLWQLCVGPTFALASTLAGDENCGQSCPCESTSLAELEHSDEDPCDDSCDLDDSNQQCPPDCSDCTCTLVVMAVSLSEPTCPHTQTDATKLTPRTDRPCTGVSARIFRPPKHAQV